MGGKGLVDYFRDECFTNSFKCYVASFWVNPRNNILRGYVTRVANVNDVQISEMWLLVAGFTV